MRSPSSRLAAIPVLIYLIAPELHAADFVKSPAEERVARPQGPETGDRPPGADALPGLDDARDIAVVAVSRQTFDDMVRSLSAEERGTLVDELGSIRRRSQHGHGDDWVRDRVLEVMVKAREAASYRHAQIPQPGASEILSGGAYLKLEKMDATMASRTEEGKVPLRDIDDLAKSDKAVTEEAVSTVKEAADDLKHEDIESQESLERGLDAGFRKHWKLEKLGYKLGANVQVNYTWVRSDGMKIEGEHDIGKFTALVATTYFGGKAVIHCAEGDVSCLKDVVKAIREIIDQEQPEGSVKVTTVSR